MWLYHMMPVIAMHSPANFFRTMLSPNINTPPDTISMVFRWPTTLYVSELVAPVFVLCGSRQRV